MNSWNVWKRKASKPCADCKRKKVFLSREGSAWMTLLADCSYGRNTYRRSTTSQQVRFNSFSALWFKSSTLAVYLETSKHPMQIDSSVIALLTTSLVHSARTPQEVHPQGRAYYSNLILKWPKQDLQWLENYLRKTVTNRLSRTPDTQLQKGSAGDVLLLSDVKAAMKIAKSPNCKL